MPFVLRTVGKVRWDIHLPFIAFYHELHCLSPALDYLLKESSGSHVTYRWLHKTDLEGDCVHRGRKELRMRKMMSNKVSDQCVEGSVNGMKGHRHV